MSSWNSKSVEIIEKTTGLKLEVISKINWDVYSFYSENRKDCEIKMNGLEPEVILKNILSITNYFLKMREFDLNSLIKGKLVLGEEDVEHYYRRINSKKMKDSPDLAYVKAYTTSR